MRPDFKPKPVMKKVFSDPLLQEQKTTVHKVLLVENATCGSLKIEVKAGKSTRSAAVQFRCGEVTGDANPKFGPFEKRGRGRLRAVALIDRRPRDHAP